MGYGGGGMIGFDFEPFGHLSVEEADQLIHKNVSRNSVKTSRHETDIGISSQYVGMLKLQRYL